MTHTSPPTFWESSHETLKPTCYRIPMCSRNVNNAAKLCALHIHWNSTIHAPESLFLFSQPWTERSHCSLFSAIGLSLLRLHLRTDQGLLAQCWVTPLLPRHEFQYFFWVTLRLLGHMERKLSIHGRDSITLMFKCYTEGRKPLTAVCREN